MATRPPHDSTTTGIRADQIAQAVEWLTEMAEILESEKRYTDALKLGMLTFYFATSGVYAEPVIEDHLAKQICRVVWATGPYAP